MSWDGIKRRASDNGGEDPMIILARIDERLKNFVATMAKHEQEDHEKFVDHGKRISRMELNEARNMGISAGVAGVVGFIMRLWK